MNTEQLCAVAQKARENAYAPYSHFTVGAALLCDNGNVYTGCNIENASFSPTVCAERVAIFKAVSDGERHFTALAIAGGKMGETADITPCGVCRQVLSEFCEAAMPVYLVCADGNVDTMTLGDLLPRTFVLEKNDDNV